MAQMLTVFGSSLVCDIVEGVHPVDGSKTHTVTVTLAADVMRSHGIKRGHIFGWSTGANASLAVRLVCAIRAGRVFKTEGTIEKDVNDATFVSLPMVKFLLGRRLNADLRRMGF